MTKKKLLLGVLIAFVVLIVAWRIFARVYAQPVVPVNGSSLHFNQHMKEMMSKGELK